MKLEWKSFFDKNGVAHIVPTYAENVMQPGHVLETNCGCSDRPDVRHYPNSKRVIMVHRVIH